VSLPEQNGSIDYGETESIQWIEPEMRSQLIIAFAEQEMDKFCKLLDSLPPHKAKRALAFLTAHG
jgi:hypothetical protein